MICCASSSVIVLFSIKERLNATAVVLALLGIMEIKVLFFKKFFLYLNHIPKLFLTPAT